MKGYTEEYKNGMWVEAEPVKASWEDSFLYSLIKKIKERFKCI